MLSVSSTLATITVKPTGWGVVIAALVLGLISGVAGLRVWQGRPMNPRNTLEMEDRLAVLTVALLPSSATFLCWAAIALVSEAGSGSTGTTAVIVILVELVFGAISIITFLIAASLFFFSRPRRFMPPHLRASS
jgi:hypothetical protein